MREMITVNENTKLKDILAAYPWLPEELIRRDARFKKINSPLVRGLIQRFTVADAAKYTGYDAELLLSEFRKLIEAREE